jgi:cell division protein FtsQ
MPRPTAIADACGRALRRSLPGIAALCVLAALGSFLWLGHRFVTTSPRFAITEIRIEGTERLTADELRATIPVRVGDNVFTAKLDATVDALRAHPWIASVELRRILPHTLVVDVREHKAVAVAELGELYLVAPSGHVFKRAELGSGDGAGLPIITGIDRAAYRRDPAGTAKLFTGALAAVKQWETNDERPAIGEVHVDARGSLTLRTYDRSTAIELGQLTQIDHSLDARIRTFDAAWAALSDLERARARAIHLDARSDHVTVAFAKD